VSVKQGTRVHLEGLSFAYRGAPPTVRDVDLHVPAGRITAVLGPSGCGKTTLLKLVAGLLPPAGGRVCFDGRPIDAVPAERRGAVLVPQEHLLFPNMSVLENVAFGLRMRGVPRVLRHERARAMLAEVRLAGLGGRRPAALSGGQRQRAALARALVVEPRVLLLDEPLASLDADLRAAMRALIRQVQRAVGVTTLLVTHDRADAMGLADSVAVLLEGRVRQVDEPRAIYHRPCDVEVARLLGPASVLPATRAGETLTTPLGERPVPRGAEAKGDVGWLLRPEEVTVLPLGGRMPPPALPSAGHGQGPAEDATRLPAAPPADGDIGVPDARVHSVRFAGDHVALQVSLGEGRLPLQGRWGGGATLPELGRKVSLSIAPGAGWLLPHA
jgi:ABC-type Fe3+/spermidine/putrescine transport system ATPase subunit